MNYSNTGSTDILITFWKETRRPNKGRVTVTAKPNYLETGSTNFRTNIVTQAIVQHIIIGQHSKLENYSYFINVHKPFKLCK